MGDATLRDPWAITEEDIAAIRATPGSNGGVAVSSVAVGMLIDRIRRRVEERGTVHPDARRADLMRRVVLEAHSLATGLARRQEPSATEMHDAMHRIEQITWLLINRPEGLREAYAREDAAESSAAQQEVKE